MEITQFIQSFYLGKCNMNMNYYSTLFAMFLVAVQPLLWNTYRLKTNYMYVEVFKFASVASLIWFFAYFVRLLESDDYCDGEVNVGSKFCTYQGPTHLYWKFPLAKFHGFEANFFTYLLLWFLPALWEDKKGIFKLCIWLIQIIIVHFFTKNKNEYSSVWCLYSIPILILLATCSSL